MEIKDGIFSFSEVLKEYILFLIYKINIFFKIIKTMIIYYFMILIFLLGLIVFSSKRKHLLLILLRLEYLVLSLYLIIFFYLKITNYDNYFSIIFLRFRVCEGSLGLSILVLIIRTHGNDYIFTFSFLW